MTVTDGPLPEAAGSAPTCPGVYFFLDGDRRLLYVGKAVNLRRRLQQHAKELPTDARSKYARVRSVAWEELPDDEAACAREADLIVALQPAQNASIAGSATWTYLVVAPGAADDCRFSLLAGDPPAGAGSGERYGCFPHLGKGQTSRPGIACSDGLTALLRLLWATGPGSGRPYPRAISGPSPPFDVTIAVAPSARPALRRFLGGTSARLLDDVAAIVGDDVEPYLRPALARDLGLARGFFDHGPAALRRLRLRHGLDPGPISRTQIEDLLRTEVAAAIGPFELPEGGSERRRRRLP